MAAKRKQIQIKPNDAARRPTSLEDALAILDAFNDCGVESVQQARIYLILCVHGPRMMTEVARETGLPISTCSRLCWQLHEPLGLVDYRTHPTDRRKRIIERRG